MTTPVEYQVTWTPFDSEMREAILRPFPGLIHYDGPEVGSFEEEVARYLTVGHAVAFSSGSSALHLALLALGVGQGDEVIVQANAYVAVPESVLRVGARPRYCDIREDTANPDLELIEPLVGDRTRAIVVIHTYGNPVDMDPILALARERGLLVIEDVAHAFGGEYKGRKLGTLGDVGFTSFARKVIHVAGQGGMAFTDRAEVALAMRRLRKHGWDLDDEDRTGVAALGFNCSFSECLAAVGRVGLARVDRHWQERDRNARRYSSGLRLKGVPARPFTESPWGRHGRLHYVVRVPERDRLKEFLRTRGIGCKIHYRTPVYRLPVFVRRSGGDPGPQPVTDTLAREILTLPSHPDMGQGIDVVIDAMAAFYREEAVGNRDG